MSSRPFGRLNLNDSQFGVEPQSVSGRWRQLTRSCLRRLERLDERHLLPTLINSLVNVVIATGYEVDQLAFKQLIKRLSNRLCEIIKLAFEANKMTKEGITSCNFEVTFMNHDSLYDPNYMESVYGEPSPKLDRETVVCTVNLGLRRKERVSTPEAETKEHVILKPKVLLSTERFTSQPAV